jgi:hypothetical protein
MTKNKRENQTAIQHFIDWAKNHRHISDDINIFLNEIMIKYIDECFPIKNGKMKKCIISKYDKSITKPPFLTIPIKDVEVFKPDIDDGGSQFADNLRDVCKINGYEFKFYTMSDKPYDYEIVVY